MNLSVPGTAERLPKKSLRFVLHTGGEVDLPARSAFSIVARGQRPKITDGDCLAVDTEKLAHVLIVMREIEGVDRSISEIPNQEIPRIFAKIRRRDRKPPR